MRMPQDAALRINWLAYQYREYDGYGRYSNRLIRSLQRLGVQVSPLLAEHTLMPAWMQEQLGLEWEGLTISCLPPFYLRKIPQGQGRHWLITMTEGSALPEGWAEHINESQIDRIYVPCEANLRTFVEGGVTAPISLLPGGTDPEEFPLRNGGQARPYTFLALADRGSRKGWGEAWSAFYKAFGTPTDTPDVRLLVKARGDTNNVLNAIADGQIQDPRIQIERTEYNDMAALYAQADCFVIPARHEGWGMPQREAAMSGLPVIVQRVGGIDDGYTERWALICEQGTQEEIPHGFSHIAGHWRRANTEALAELMRRCYEAPEETAQFGRNAAHWLRDNQTWDHTAKRLLADIERELSGALRARLQEPFSGLYLEDYTRVDDGSELWA